jgi:small subunit ribosomal protein S6
MTQSYEVTFILGEAADEAAAQAKLAQLTTYVGTLEGAVTKSELWGRRELAYPIARNRSGFYVTFWAELPKQAVIALEKEIKFDESIIRSLVTKAYTSAEPGSLTFVPEEEKETKGRGRRTATSEEVAPESAPAEVKAESTDDVIAEAEEVDPLETLDAALDGIHKEETDDVPAA